MDRMVATGEETAKESFLWAPTSLFLLQTPLPTIKGGSAGSDSQRPPGEWALGGCSLRRRASHLSPLISLCHRAAL